MADNSRRITKEIIEIDAVSERRYVFGCQALLRDLGKAKIERGRSLHILSGGNIDTISYVRWLISCYGSLESILICGWAISASNIKFVERWRKSGELKHAVIILGDVYPSRYKMEWALLMKLLQEGTIDKVIIGHLHCKIMLARCGGDYIVGEGSANCNCNPRVEQIVLTNDQELYEFYECYFDKDIKESHLINAQTF